MNTSTKSVGRGRTKGSYSFTTSTLRNLCSNFGIQLPEGAGMTNVVLSRKWVESIGLQNTDEAKNSIQTLKQTVVPTSPDATATPLQVTIEE